MASHPLRFDDFVTPLVGGQCPGCRSRSARVPCARCATFLECERDSADALFHDRTAARQLVRAAKYGTWRGGARWFAMEAVDRLPVALGYVDLITWVPADRLRRARRGIHLPEAVAREIGRLRGIPVRGLLTRVDRATQFGLGRADRLEHARSAFAPRARWPRGIRVVLLIDDIRSTGATLDSCADVVRAAGPTGGLVIPLALTSNDRPYEIAEIRTER